MVFCPVFSEKNFPAVATVPWAFTFPCGLEHFQRWGREQATTKTRCGGPSTALRCGRDDDCFVLPKLESFMRSARKIPRRLGIGLGYLDVYALVFDVKFQEAWGWGRRQRPVLRRGGSR